MKPGKLSELILARTVLKKIEYKRKEVLQGAKTGTDAAILQGDGRLVTAVATQTYMEGIGMDEKPELRNLWFAKSAWRKSLNNVCVEYGTPFAVMLSLTLPVTFEEVQLKKLMQVFSELSKQDNVQIAGGHTEVSPYVTAPVCSVTAYGYRKEEPVCVKDSEALDVVMAGELGREGTGLMACFQQEKLQQRFLSSYVEKAEAFLNRTDIRRMAEIAGAYQAVMHDVSGTGIFGALWELGEKLHCGMEISLKDIPVCQETIELSEYLEMNPYTMPSGGALLSVVKDGAGLVRAYEREGIRAVVIGRITKEKARVILNQEEKRFLEQPR